MFESTQKLTPDQVRAATDLLTHVPIRTLVGLAAVATVGISARQLRTAATWPVVVGVIVVAAMLVAAAVTVALWPVTG